MRARGPFDGRGPALRRTCEPYEERSSQEATMTPNRVTLAAIALTLMTAAGVAAQDSGFGAGTPEMRYFRVESAVSEGRRGPRVEGYVYNTYDVHAIWVRLRVEAVDAAGRPVQTRAPYVPLDPPPRRPATFSPPQPPATDPARTAPLELQSGVPS